MVEPGKREPLDQLLLDLRDLGWLTPSDALLLDAKVAALTAERDRLAEAEEAALRVLYEVISTNEAWETGRPNELTDDAIRIGHEFPIERGWWPRAALTQEQP